MHLKCECFERNFKQSFILTLKKEKKDLAFQQLTEEELNLFHYSCNFITKNRRNFLQCPVIQMGLNLKYSLNLSIGKDYYLDMRLDCETRFES